MAGDRLFHRVRKDRWLRVARGEGCWLYGDDGRAWLDACAGVHVVSIGHGVPEIAEAMQAQARKVAFTYSRFLTDPQIDLADRIAAMTPGDLNRVFFVSGGSEATESAMKIARKYHLETGNPGKHKIVSRWQSWHGNTVGALSMSGRSSVAQRLRALPPRLPPHPPLLPVPLPLLPRRVRPDLRRGPGAGHPAGGGRHHRRLHRRARSSEPPAPA